MSYTSTDPEDYNRDPETSSLASTSTSTTSLSQQSTKKKKPWSKFKSSIKSIGEKMSARPKFTDPTESSEQKKVKKGRKGKASGNGEKSSTSTPEETPRAKSPTKNLMKKLSMDTPLMISTPFVGYQPASVSPAKSYAKALHQSGSTSESNLSASDIDTPKKSYTLDRNTKLAQESPDSGRASQAQGSLEGSRPPSQIKEVASDVSVDSDYTSPSRGGLDDLVTKTEAFAQSLPPKKDSEVSVDFIKAETVVKPPTGVADKEKKEDKPEKAQDKSETPQGKAQNKSETPPDNVKEKKPDQVDEVKVSNEDGVDGRKRRGSGKGSKKEDSSVSLIDSERSSAKPGSPVSSETKQAETKDASKSKPSEETQGPLSKPEQRINKDHSHEKKDSDRKTEKSISKEGKDNEDTKAMTETKPEKSTDKTRSQEQKERDNKKDHSARKENSNIDTNVKPETKPTPTTKDIKETADKSEKPESKTEPDEKSGKTPVTAPKEPAKTTEPVKKEEPKPKTPQKSDDAEKSALSKTLPKPKDEPPLPDLGAATPLSVEEKLQAFLSAEGYSGTIKDVPAKSSDGVS